MLTRTKKDIRKLDKKLNKIKLWLDIYETLLYATDNEDEYEEVEDIEEVDESEEDKKEE